MEEKKRTQLGSIAIGRHGLEEAVPAYSKPESRHPSQLIREGFFSSVAGSDGELSSLNSAPKDSVSLDEASKRFRPPKGTALIGASVDFASNVQNSVLNRGWRQLEKVFAFPLSALPSNLVSNSLSSLNLFAEEVKQAYGTSAVVVRDVKRKLVDTFLSYTKNQERKVAEAVDNSSSEISALADGHRDSAKTALSTYAELRQTDKPFPSSPSMATTHQNGRVAIHLRSRL